MHNRKKFRHNVFVLLVISLQIKLDSSRERYGNHKKQPVRCACIAMATTFDNNNVAHSTRVQRYRQYMQLVQRCKCSTMKILRNLEIPIPHTHHLSICDK